MSSFKLMSKFNIPLLLERCAELGLDESEVKNFRTLETWAHLGRPILENPFNPIYLNMVKSVDETMPKRVLFYHKSDVRPYNAIELAEIARLEKERRKKERVTNTMPKSNGCKGPYSK